MAVALQQTSGPDAWDFFGSTQMVEAMTIIARLRREAIAAGRPDIQAGISRVGVELQRELDRLARRTVEVADEAIVRKLRSSRRRPHTDRSRHLEDSIRSIPFPGLGGVKIALIEELDKAVNPGGYGPYWRAIEFGSVEVGNPMTGRTLYGTFTGGGSSPERPRYEYRRDVIGDGAIAPHAQFEWHGEDTGKGIIHNEIEGRHFLKEGTDEAWAFYAAEVARIDARVSREVLGLIA